MPNPTVYMTDDEKRFVEEHSDDDDPSKPSFSGFIRSLIRDEMEAEGVA